MRTSPRLDFLKFIRSVVGGLLKTASSASSGLNGRRIINTSVDLHHPVNAKTQHAAQTAKKNTIKNCQECGVFWLFPASAHFQKLHFCCLF